ncbi:hypothetical protein ACFOWX_01695 [Sphingorhabdus arenilitoris]|uniref:Uncharacterized protein n=1 Tax=Sphingorhabdus arenilitoris TaxID=1490041 RepID=A0ABV8RD42_9SPHN
MLHFMMSLMMVCALASCKTADRSDDGAGAAGTRQSSSIYYKSQSAADAALAAFDKDNPTCQLWTNWQKMCSRANPDARSLCVTQKHNSVAPSAPFCVASVYKDSKVTNISSSDTRTLLSIARFCDGKTSLETNPEWDIHTAVGFCAYQENRPFVLKQPFTMNELASQWIIDNFDESQMSEHSILESYDEHRSNWCNDFDVLGMYEQEEFGGDGVIMPTLRIKNIEPVFGIFCRSQKRISAAP